MNNRLNNIWNCLNEFYYKSNIWLSYQINDNFPELIIIGNKIYDSCGTFTDFIQTTKSNLILNRNVNIVDEFKRLDKIKQMKIIFMDNLVISRNLMMFYLITKSYIDIFPYFITLTMFCILSHNGYFLNNFIPHDSVFAFDWIELFYVVIKNIGMKVIKKRQCIGMIYYVFYEYFTINAIVEFFYILIPVKFCYILIKYILYIVSLNCFLDSYQLCKIPSFITNNFFISFYKCSEDELIEYWFKPPTTEYFEKKQINSSQFYVKSRFWFF